MLFVFMVQYCYRLSLQCKLKIKTSISMEANYPANNFATQNRHLSKPLVPSPGVSVLHRAEAPSR